MGFALFALTSLYQPLRRIAGSMRQRPAHHCLPGPTSGTYLAASQASNDPQCAAIGDRSAHPAVATSATQVGHMPIPEPAAVAPVRPLRVILNRNEGKSCRLVISGRMADVCAELNRLALN